jgi:hypothetical protein
MDIYAIRARKAALISIQFEIVFSANKAHHASPKLN